ncbi:MAG: hypothetical protein AB2L24_31845 [Mangrovibacterium sp.]
MKTFYLLLFLLSHMLMGYAQQDFVYRGKIADASTKLPLQDVKIYKICNGDTIMTRCNVNGEFQILLNTDSKLFFKKKGYAWHIVKISNKDNLQIYLTPSKKRSKTDIGIENYDKKDVYFDGQLVPQEEWDDAGSIDPDLAHLEILSGKYSKDGRNKIYFKTK